MKKPIYNSIGKDYNQNRTADNRILAEIVDLLDLPPGSIVADIGAGTGNYANALAGLGYGVLAVEPSEEMRNQATAKNRVRWLPATAEAIPLEDNSVDGVIVILALHHFSNVTLAAKEIVRICPEGPLLVFTMDTRESEEFWFNDYFPEIAEHVRRVFPSINEIAGTIADACKWHTAITKFPLPRDLADKNMCSAWGSPESYLDTQMRQNTSGFALASPDVVQRGVSRLQDDLQSGEWDRNNGQLRHRKYFDAGFRFLRFAVA